MKKKEFFEELKKIDKERYYPFLSKLGDDTSIGRMRLKDLSQNGLYCPVTAVCYNKTKKFFYPGEAMEAAALMGLSKQFCCKVMSAADDYHHRDCPACGNDIFRVTIGRFLIWLYRSRMLKILGLEPKVIDYG